MLEVVPAAELRPPPRPSPPRSRRRIPLVIRLAKQSLNGIDPVDVKRSYRYEQGFTFELNLAGAGTGHGGLRGSRRAGDAGSARETTMTPPC